jgi:hypothetical protein
VWTFKAHAKGTSMTGKSYLYRATKRFLSGTRYESPIEAVEKGIRTLDEWTLILSEERELERPYSKAALDARRFLDDIR